MFKNKWKIIAISGWVVAVVLFIILVTAIQKTLMEPPQTTTQTEEQEPKTQHESNLLTFENQELGIRFEYPKEWAPLKIESTSGDVLISTTKINGYGKLFLSLP